MRVTKDNTNSVTRFLRSRDLGRSASARLRQIAFVVAAVLLSAVTPEAGAKTCTEGCLRTALEPGERNCVVKRHEKAARLAHTFLKNAQFCLKSASLDRISEPGTCLESDPRGKLTRATESLVAVDAKHCKEAPPFGYVDSALTQSAAHSVGEDLVSSLFGTQDLGQVILSRREDRQASRCQQDVLSGVAKLFGAQMKAYSTCLRTGLANRTSPISSAAGMTTCLEEVGGHRVVQRAVAALRKKIEKTCLPVIDDESWQWQELLPGLAVSPSEQTDLTSFLTNPSRCLMCELSNALGNLSVDCDLFDDGIANLSCGAQARGLLSDIRLTQSGLVTRALPALPLVAGKTALVRTTLVAVPGGPTRVDDAVIDVIRVDTGATVGVVRGHAIAADDRTRRSEIETGDDIHFFIPGRLLADAAPYEIVARLGEGGRTWTVPLVSWITTQENGGISMVLLDYDEGIFSDLSSQRSFRGTLEHTARMLPIKNRVDDLLPRGAPTTRAAGLRFAYVHQLPLPAQGSQGNFEREFVLRDMLVGTWINSAGQACAANVPRRLESGRFFAFNFSYPEDLDRDGVFSAAELAICTPPPGRNSSMLNRVTNFGNRMLNDVDQQKGRVASIKRSERAAYGLALVSGGRPDSQNRVGWLGSASPRSGWATISMGAAQFPTLPHELGHELQLPHAAQLTLPGPAYDLLLKRRVRNPFNLMAGGFLPNQANRNSFVSDADWDAILGILPRAIQGETPPGPLARLLISGERDLDGKWAFGEIQPLGVDGESDLRPDLTLALLDNEERVLAKGHAQVSIAGERADVPAELADSGALAFHGDVEWVEGTSFLVLYADQTELLRRAVSDSSPKVDLSVDPDGLADGVLRLAWSAGDADGDTLRFDVLAEYLDGRSELLAAGLSESSIEIESSRVPGGSAALKVIASDGFHRSESNPVTIELPNLAPQVLILTPEDGESVEGGSTIGLRASVRDPERESLEGDQILWHSDLTGFLGIGTDLDVVLPPGTHVLTAEAADSGGARGSAQVTIPAN